MRLKPQRRTPLHNGSLDCRLFGFELVSAGYRDKDGAARHEEAGDADEARRETADDGAHSDEDADEARRADAAHEAGEAHDAREDENEDRGGDTEEGAEDGKKDGV
jgi:putative N6-adenine-specific DNA methylase